MKTLLYLMSVLTVFLCGCTTYDIVPHTREQMIHEMEQEKFISTNGVSFCYRIYRPNCSWKVPVVFYLHGIGQRGNDNVTQLDDAVGSIMSITCEKNEYSSVVVAPQCPTSYLWRDEVMLDTLEDFIKTIVSSSNEMIDSNRVYVTGFSMGGDGSWKLALKCPNILSTVVPVCGGPLESMEPDRPEVREEVSRLNIWAFNNFDDKVVKSNYSKYLFSKIWSYRLSDNLNFTENIEGSHSYSDVYGNRKYMIWMLSTIRK